MIGLAFPMQRAVFVARRRRRASGVDMNGMFGKGSDLRWVARRMGQPWRSHACGSDDHYRYRNNEFSRPD